MMLILFAVVAVVLAIFYIRFVFSYWKRRNVYQLEPSWIFGNFKDVILSKESFYKYFLNIHLKFKAMGLKYGGLYFFWQPAFLPIDINLIKDIMSKNFDHFVDRNMYIDEINDPLTANLLQLKGDKWKSMRHKLTPTFTSGKLKMMFQIFKSCSSQLTNVLRQQAKRQTSIDIKDVLARFTTDVIGSCAFGLECNTLNNSESEFRVYSRRVFENTFFENIKGMISILLPSWFMQIFNIHVTNRDVEKFFVRLVDETIDYRQKNEVTRKDFLQLLLKLREENKGEYDDFTMTDLYANCFVFFLAGFETSSTAMTFTLYELAKNQNIQEKLRREIDDVLEKYNGDFSYEAVGDMTYLENVVNESLRKFPPAPHIARKCTKPYKVPGTDLILNPGQAVNISIAGIHWDPEYYPDPEKFDPDRFSEENKASRPNYAFLPFGEGPRRCIGLRFGLLQTKLGVATIIKNFKVSLNPKTKEPLEFGTGSFITSAKDDIWLDVTEVLGN